MQAILLLLLAGTLQADRQAQPDDFVHFHRGLAAIGDVNAVEGDELLVALSADDENELVVLCGRTGEAIDSLSLPSREEGVAVEIDRIVPLGDLNGDGSVEAACASAGWWKWRGRVVLVSARPLEVRDQLLGAGPGDSFGASVAACGDLDLDGFPDLAVGAPGQREDRVGEIMIVSGATRGVLRNVRGLRARDAFGTSLAGGGDFDGDGVQDLLVGAVEPEPAYAHPGYVALVSGADGSWLRMFRGKEGDSIHGRTAAFEGDRGFGSSVAAIRDVDDDGWPDLAIGVPQDANRGRREAPRVEVRSGRTGRVLHEALGEPGSFFGGALVPGDLDGDDVLDLVISASESHAFSGAWHVLSGRTGRTLRTILVPRDEEGEGWGVIFGSGQAATADLDGDGRSDLAFTARRFGEEGRWSSVRVIRSRDWDTPWRASPSDLQPLELREPR